MKEDLDKIIQNDFEIYEDDDGKRRDKLQTVNNKENVCTNIK